MRRVEKTELNAASIQELQNIAGEMREEILRTVSANGGHLSSNLGTVELTIALHRVFSFPKDKIIFDVGHQCYTHKLLSERASVFHTLRKSGGISGFPKRSESEYDAFDTGHAGTAISAALGIAKARDLKGENFEVIALVGDGSFHNGLIYEALNNLRGLNTRILILLNDNGLSISPTHGGMHDALEGFKAGEGDLRLFEQYGVKYLGGCDGNDFTSLLPALEEAKECLKTQSVLLHVVTKKGKGYAFAEESPTQTHGVAAGGTQEKKEYGAALGEELMRLAKGDGRIAVVTAAMTDALGLRPFFEAFPERSFDAGICEEHASIFAAGLAAGGYKPYYAIYSTFLQRAFDEIVHDICAQNLPVTLCIDRAGAVGEDGQTHQGVFDLSYLSLIPNLTIGIPADISQFRAMLELSAKYDAPFAIRYPRLGTEGRKRAVEIGKFEILHSTMSDITILAAGERCVRIAEEGVKQARACGADATLINACFVKPLDEELLSTLKSKYILTMEDGALIGGLGDAVRRFYKESGKTVLSLGYPDAFVPHGDISSQLKGAGLTAEHAAELVVKYARG